MISVFTAIALNLALPQNFFNVLAKIKEAAPPVNIVLYFIHYLVNAHTLKSILKTSIFFISAYC